MHHPYQGRSLALATLHDKQQVFVPAFDTLDVRIVTPQGLDTDQFGTFSGETPRRGTMRAVAIEKARLGMAATGLSIGLASEGSFGPHQAAPFLRAGVELAVLVDDERGIVITERHTTLSTNFDACVAVAGDDVQPFLSRVQFPAHGLIVRPNTLASPWWKLHPDLRLIFKGIRNRSALEEAIAACARRSEDGLAHIDTDMRAHMNPTRMASISELAHKLARRIACLCPACATPGFGPVSYARGLPCRICGEESITPSGEILGCVACDWRVEARTHDLHDLATPGDCPVCNP
jgi:hypothetical protein